MFDAWLLTQQAGEQGGLGEGTESVLRSMWMAFGAWCIKNELDPITLTAAELDAYLKSREGALDASELSLRYSWRLVTLIDRVINAVVGSSASGNDALVGNRNRAASDLLQTNRALRQANRDSADPLPEFLTASEDRVLVSFLEASVPRKGKDAGYLHGLQWQDVRNRTAVALHRGAGLTPLELRRLTVNSVFVDPEPRKGPWKVRAPATGSVLEHDAPVAAWVRPLLTYWMRQRVQLDIPGDWLLPSTKTGKPWGKTAHFEAVASVLDAAGLVGFKGGSYLLRHTFAVKQLARKEVTDAQVASWLGIDESEMGRYRRVLAAPVDVY